MSLQKLLCYHLIWTLAAFLVVESANVYYRYRLSRCIYSSSNISDMVYFNSYYFNTFLFIQFDSTLGRFVGFNEFGMKLAESWNRGPLVHKERAVVDWYCKGNAQVFDSAICEKSVKPQVKLSSVTQAGGNHPAVLMCSAYEFYPPHIKVSWLRDGKLMTSEVTSTMEMADGDWYYQIHSELEYTPKSGEKISCVVEHASFHKPMIYDWDPSLPESERNKIAIGSSGLVLGIIIAAAGLIYYKKKSTGRILVPH
ncbi:H-2 class II histocompatibility antigen, E-S beta chain-like isoform X1 [Pimephales promelas]|uniref:H-2 class II histocompatibility antigen, E-S beta chain-like isoform X1 n=1 Tax=Pimephales promelas TaxID=90988 RepID=UPI001955D687|nr:H-2 class II histocompatibility antigen, E-S beta chain-like isoform X1 [Pimephales promelas]